MNPSKQCSVSASFRSVSIIIETKNSIYLANLNDSTHGIVDLLPSHHTHPSFWHGISPQLLLQFSWKQWNLCFFEHCHRRRRLCLQQDCQDENGGFQEEWRRTFLRGGTVNTFLETTLDFDIANGRCWMERRRSCILMSTSDIYHVVAQWL